MPWGILFFLLLLLPYQGMIPTLDGRHDLVNTLLSHANNTLHPPLKPVLLQLLINLFGNYSYTWLGLLIGVFGIIGIYFLTKLLTNNKQNAIIASFLLAMSGLYVSTSLFSMTDFMITVFALWAFYCYYTQRVNWYIVISALGILTKETFLVLPLSVLIVSIFQKRLKWQYFHPLIIFGIWLGMIRFFHLSPWNQQNFSEFAKFGSFGTIFMNLVTLKIFNQYALASWTQMLVLNFNWFFWLVALIFMGSIQWSKKIIYHLSPIILFVFLYIFFVLSFPTWIIPRYMLPVLPFLYIFLSAHLWKNKVLFVLVFLVSFMSLFYSIDPVSHYLYKDRAVLQKNFYDVPFSGVDGITYNMQYLNFTKQANKMLNQKEMTDCFYIFLGMKDDKELRSIYHFPVKPCP